MRCAFVVLAVAATIAVAPSASAKVIVNGYPRFTYDGRRDVDADGAVFIYVPRR